MLYEATGLAAWSPFGGGINMPTLQKLADRGPRYSQWHTTALCSPTRSTLLTGRNHHHVVRQRIERRQPILGVAVTVGKGQYLDLEKMAAAAFGVD